MIRFVVIAGDRHWLQEEAPRYTEADTHRFGETKTFKSRNWWWRGMSCPGWTASGKARETLADHVGYQGVRIRCRTVTPEGAASIAGACASVRVAEEALRAARAELHDAVEAAAARGTFVVAERIKK